jgi:outer membrane receptor protein involved in Fe transport
MRGNHLNLIVLFLVCALATAHAATIKGHVLDSKTSEALLGAVVYNKDNKAMNGSTGLDGTYSIKNIGKGTYTVVTTYFGYVTMEKTVVISDSAETVVQDFLMEANVINLGQVQVTASADKGSDNYARTEEKNSDNVINVMSSKTIQLLPDITIGDVLQRVSGVVAERSLTGGGQYATIRGMDKQYNYTSIDDVKIPSPDLENRYVPMDIFPSEMVERLEVIKTLTPDREADAIGGAMNLVLKDAPDAFTLTANVATGFDQTLLNKGYEQFNPNVINANSPAQIYGPSYKATVNDFPTANINYKDVTAPPNLVSGFTIGDRFFGGRFGVLVSANYQNVYSATEGLWIKLQSQPEYSPTYNTPDWDFISNRYYSDQQTRAAGHIKMDYIFSPKHRISFYTVYSQMSEIRSRLEQDTTNSLPNSEMDPHYQSKVTYEHILSSTLKGKDSLAHHLLLDWTAAYSRAWANTPDWDDISILGSVGGSPPPVFSGLSRVWQQSTDQDIAGYINLTYDFTVFGQKVELKAGAMNRDKSRSAYYNEYDFNATPTQPSYTNINAILANPNYYVFVDPLGYPGDNNTYTVQEDVNAFYGMIKLNLGTHIQILGGIREENTASAYQDAEPADLAGKYGSNQYTDVLPSAEIKYSFTNNMAIRGSYFASIARPGFADAVPTLISTDEFTQEGNPYLQHTTANNYDIRYEYFPKPSEQLLVGVFYKQIYNPIELSIIPGSGPSATYQQYQNVGGDSVPVINYGFEFAYTKYFWHVFGISANYTYTHSAITVNELKLGTSSVPGESMNKREDTVETRPMQGQVDNIANLSFIYKEPKLGLEAQIAVVYTGKSIYTTSAWYGLDQWQMPMTRLDFSFEKKLSKKINLSLYGKINNILNTPLTIRMFPPNAYANTPGTAAWLPKQDSNGSLSSIVVQKEYYGQTYLMGVRYKF